MDTEKLLIQLNKNDQWIQNVDTKISILLTFLGVFSGFILALEDIEKLFDFNSDDYLWILTLFFLLTAFFVILSIRYSLKGMKATLKNKNPGLWFFGDVAKYQHSSYFARKKLNQTDEQFDEELLIQIYNTAKIANEKFILYNRSLYWTKYAVLSYILYHVFSIFI
ncbi:Pycsar system effector family protein [Halalkalibacter oceani]|uniref:Pycsar system effector family protein n=1 Tax=Halalkalibacter oceani TaxID=1653776 RepID=UPI003393C479